MNNNLLSLLFIAIIIAFVGTEINNKLYDIRELINGTCIHENTYNGSCISNH